MNQQKLVKNNLNKCNKVKISNQQFKNNNKRLRNKKKKKILTTIRLILDQKNGLDSHVTNLLKML